MYIYVCAWVYTPTFNYKKILVVLKMCLDIAGLLTLHKHPDTQTSTSIFIWIYAFAYSCVDSIFGSIQKNFLNCKDILLKL